MESISRLSPGPSSVARVCGVGKFMVHSANTIFPYVSLSGLPRSVSPESRGLSDRVIRVNLPRRRPSRGISPKLFFDPDPQIHPLSPSIDRSLRFPKLRPEPFQSAAKYLFAHNRLIRLRAGERIGGMQLILRDQGRT